MERFVMRNGVLAFFGSIAGLWVQCCGVIWERKQGLSSFKQTIAEPVVKLGDGLDFICSGFDVILNADELDLSGREHDVTRAWVVVAGLTDRADIDDRFLVLGELEDGLGADLRRRVEIGFIREHAGLMGMADEGDLFDAVEDSFELVGRVVGVFGEDVLIDRSAGRCVDRQDIGAVTHEIFDRTDSE